MLRCGRYSGHVHVQNVLHCQVLSYGLLNLKQNGGVEMLLAEGLCRKYTGKKLHITLQPLHTK